MKRDGVWVWVCFVLVPAVMGVFVAGWQQVRADPPECTQCDCKEVARWWASGITWPMGTGNKQTVGMITSNVPQGISFIWSIPGTCLSGPSSSTGVTVDNYNFTTCYAICDYSNSGAASPMEVGCTDAGTYSGPMTKRKCAS